MGIRHRRILRGAGEVNMLQQQVQQVMSIYNAVSHVTDLGSAVSALGLLGIQNPLPVNPYAVQSLLNGTGSVEGMAGSIGSLFNSNWETSHVYTPTGTSYEASLMERGATSIAGIPTPTNGTATPWRPVRSRYHAAR